MFTLPSPHRTNPTRLSARYSASIATRSARSSGDSSGSRLSGGRICRTEAEWDRIEGRKSGKKTAPAQETQGS